MSLARTKKKRLPAVAMPVAKFVEPMKALGVSAVPPGVWHCEIKYDGYRALAVLNQGSVELWSRNEKDMTGDYPPVVAALAALKCQSAILDGEICALDDAGRSRFQLLQGREINGRDPKLVFYIFDVLSLDGKSLVAEPIERRREVLTTVLGRPVAPLQLSPAFSTDPRSLMEEVQRQGLEGIIAKRPGSLYEVGRRSGAWLKCKVLNEQEFVIGGFTPPQKSRPSFGAILVGYHEKGKLLYSGKVGSGFSHALLGTLHREFLKRKTEHCPFVNLPMVRKPRFGQGMTRAEMRKVTWIEPSLVAQVKFAEWTHDGLLRQPVFLGLRKDKAAKDVTREKAPALGKGKKTKA